MRKRRNRLKKLFASVLSAAMLVTMIPQAASAAGSTTAPLLADFTFDDDAGVVTGGNAKAEVHGSYTLEDSRNAASGKALHLDGNAANYLSLTDKEGKSLLAGKEIITISYDVKPERVETNWSFYAAPDANKQNSNQEHYIGAFHNNGNVKVERYHNTGSRPAAAEVAAGSGWTHVDAVFTETATSVYINGTKKAEVASTYKLSDILGSSGVFYIGRANWVNGEGFKGLVDNFKVYDGALTEAQIQENTKDLAQEAVAADKAELTLPKRAAEDFTLPSAGTAGSVITWTSGDTDIITIEGTTAKVVRPAVDTDVELTAVITCGTVSDTKTITVMVPAPYTDASTLQIAKEELALRDADAIKENITLPAEVEVEGSGRTVTVTWKSDNTNVITDTEKDGKAAGVVTRQDSDTKVNLTATLTCGNETVVKVIPVTVKKKANLAATTDYLFAFFVNNGGPAEQQIFFGSSRDGDNWKDLNDGQPVLSVADSVRDADDIANTRNQAGVRDPYMIRSPQGDKFYLIATDLCIGANNIAAGTVDWGVSQFNGSHCLRVWESDDLVNWSEPWLADVAPAGTTCAWAPEAVYNDATGNYVVFWASMTGSVQKVYYSETRDFRTFTEPKKMIDNGADHIIDTTIIKAEDGNYYRGSAASGTIRIEKCIDNENWLGLDTWEVQGYIRELAGFDPNLEGPELFKYNEDDYKEVNGKKAVTYGLLADNYGSRGYVPFYTTDIANAKWVQSPSYNFDALHKRHGTILPLTAEEYSRVMAAYSDEPVVDPGPVDPADKKVLAQFDFDDEETGFVSENAKAEGTHALADSWGEAGGKALYLNGSADNFLTVTNKEGGSLLAGAQELTVSFEAKPERTSTNWPFYAAPDKNAPQYNVSEHYIGFLMNGGKLTVERYNQNGGRPQNPSAVLGSDWTRVDVTMTADKTSIYINGALASEAASNYKIEDILGNSGILQIGKANWGEGEFYKGWIDNMTIRSYAMTADEVKAEAETFLTTQPLVEGAVVGTAPTADQANEYRGTDDHTAINTEVDAENRTLTPYIRKTADVTKVPVTLKINGAVEMTAAGKAFTNGSELDLTKDVEVIVKGASGKEETWTVKAAVVCNNPVLPGQYADPDIDYFDGKFWIYPTTDGYSGWSGHLFHAFSSEDMVNWTDEGVILDLKDDNPGLNEKGVQIAASPWASGNAWAPTIEEKDGKYYFYYCGRTANDGQAIGVAVADKPAGPYVDKGEPLVTTSMCRNSGVNMGQAIDPSIFTDEDGTSYIMFGNGAAAMAELGDDMMSIREGSFKQINGLRDFRESPVVIKVGDKYHWTWSCDDTGSPNYHVNYGVSDTLDGNVTYVKTLLSKNESKNMLGTAHQSMLKITDVYGKERYFMAYHRFYTPLNIFTGGLGYHRETCIDEVFIGEDGYMQITPTMEGVGKVRIELDKSALQAAVDAAPTDASKYTEESWSAYETAWKAAQAVLEKEDVSQEEIDAAEEALLKAEKTLVPVLPYVDVDRESGDWYYDAVYYNYLKGTMTGIDPTHFAPYSTLVRAQVSVILYRMAGSPEVEGDYPFKDKLTETDKWFENAVIWAEKEGIIKGYESGDKAGYFGPNDSITREQMAAMLYRYADYRNYDITAVTDYSKFEDADQVQAFAKELIGWAVAENIITGKDKGMKLDPQGATSRAECAIMIQRFMERYEK